MILKDSSSRNKLGAFFLFLLMGGSLSAQWNGKKSYDAFLNTQFWLGLRMGGNVTQAFPETRYAGFSPINYSADSLEKEYGNFNLLGAHMGLEMNLYHKGFSISFQPTFKRSRYEYSSAIEWSADDANDRFQTTYDVETRLDLIELPLAVKYDFVRYGKIRPFVMLGGYYTVIASAQKEVDITNTDFSSGTPLRSDGGNTILGVKDAFKAFYGVAGGVGLNLDYWNIRSVFEISYRYGLSPVTRPRVQENEFASLGEINDEVSLRELNVSLGFVFPFRFIDKQFSAN